MSMTPRAATPLEPCRCGGRAIYLRNDECFRLACVHSLAAPPTCLASTPWLQDPEDVRQWWNTRAPSSPLGSRDRIDTTICNGLSICDCGSTEFRIGIATNGPNDSNYIRALECRHCKHVMPVPFQQGDPSSPLVGELVEAACQFGPILKTFGWWDWTAAELGDLADYDDELPAVLKNASRRLYDAIEEYKLQSALTRAGKERG